MEAVNSGINSALASAIASMPADAVQPARKAKVPRVASTYRGARRNQVIRVERRMWRGMPAKQGNARTRTVKSYPYASKRQLERYAELSEADLLHGLEGVPSNRWFMEPVTS